MRHGYRALPLDEPFARHARAWHAHACFAWDCCWPPQRTRLSTPHGRQARAGVSSGTTRAARVACPPYGGARWTLVRPPVCTACGGAGRAWGRGRAWGARAGRRARGYAPQGEGSKARRAMTASPVPGGGGCGMRGGRAHRPLPPQRVWAAWAARHRSAGMHPWADAGSARAPGLGPRSRGRASRGQGAPRVMADAPGLSCDGWASCAAVSFSSGVGGCLGGFPSVDLAPNAALQAPPIAGARDERRLSAVACKRLLGPGSGLPWSSPTSPRKMVPDTSRQVEITHHEPQQRDRLCHGDRHSYHCVLARNWRIPSIASCTAWWVLLKVVGLWAASFRSFPHDPIRSESLAVTKF